MAFWGSWGEEVEDIILCCPQTGNKDRRDFCNNVGAYDPTNPDSDPGDVNSICAGDDGFDELLCGRDKNDESVAYKLKDGDTVGIYHWKDEGVDSGRVIVETGQNCTDLDALGVAEDGETPLLVESVAMERDSFRGTNLVVSVACALVSDEGDEEVEGDWGGIYLQTVCPPQIFRDDVIC